MGAMTNAGATIAAAVTVAAASGGCKRAVGVGDGAADESARLLSSLFQVAAVEDLARATV